MLEEENDLIEALLDLCEKYDVCFGFPTEEELEYTPYFVIGDYETVHDTLDKQGCDFSIAAPKKDEEKVLH